MIRWVVRLAVLVGAAAALYVAVTFIQVWHASRQDDPSPASAIVVMGAAQWNGVPSPVLRARLDHAAELWTEGAAPVVVVTGGKQPGDATTQGQTGYQYLRDVGLPDEALKVEVGGTNSYEELAASAVILRQAELGDDVIVVTDPYHAFRVEAIAREVGLDAHVSPTSSTTSMRSLARETAAVAVGRLVGYRRMANLL